MSKSVAVLSSASISHDELAEFILELGGHITKHQSMFGRISNGLCHIWIDLSPRELAAAIEDDFNWIIEVRNKLGGQPQTWVTVDISRTEGSDVLALDFAIRFGERWPAILDDLDNNLFTYKELIHCRVKKQGIRRFVNTNKVNF